MGAAPAPGGFTEDKNGDLVRKWVVDYAPRDGAGRATCRDLDCSRSTPRATS